MEKEKKLECTMDDLFHYGINHLIKNNQEIFLLLYKNKIISFSSVELEIYLHFCEIAKVQLAKKNIKVIIN